MISITRNQFDNLLKNKIRLRQISDIIENINEFEDEIKIAYITSNSDSGLKYTITTDDPSDIINSLNKIQKLNIKINHILIKIVTDEAIYLTQILENINNSTNNHSIINIKIEITDECKDFEKTINLQIKVIRQLVENFNKENNPLSI